MTPRVPFSNNIFMILDDDLDNVSLGEILFSSLPSRFPVLSLLGKGGE